jgi:aromatic amino acid aminotransferase I / 2-aminoadipate transaminase
MAPPSPLEPVGLTDTQIAAFQGPLSINGVMARRQKAPNLPTAVAAFVTSDMYKGNQQGKPAAKRWDNHFNEETRSREPSALKGTARYLGNPGLISLGGGLPSPQYFPVESMNFKVPKPPGFSEDETSKSGVTTGVRKYDIRDRNGTYDLSVALNYGQGTGSPPLLRFVTEHTELVHNPPYRDWQCSCSVGSTSALDMAYRMFLNRGEFVITEKFTFSTAIETCRPMGIRAVGIDMDRDGMIPTALDMTLTNWDSKARGGPKPKLLYTIPTGANPTGATLSEERRREIYRICQKHDIYIMEDEPYYFLQMQPYTGRDAPDLPPPSSHAEFLRSLVPSYLSLDVDGRVMRLDSFSKVISPGARVGWITASHQVVERFIRHSEFSTQNPSGFSQIFLYKLLDENWGHAGYLDWLVHLRLEYTNRRNMMLAACEDHLPAEIASWMPPMAGMFHWIQIRWEQHPQKDQISVAEIEDRVFEKAVANGVLLVKGSMFLADEDEGEASPEQGLFFRATYAAAREDQIVEAIRRFGDALREEFGLASTANARTNGVNGS